MHVDLYKSGRLYDLLDRIIRAITNMTRGTTQLWQRCNTQLLAFMLELGSAHRGGAMPAMARDELKRQTASSEYQQLLGSSLIICSGLYTFLRERRLARAALAAAA